MPGLLREVLKTPPPSFSHRSEAQRTAGTELRGQLGERGEKGYASLKHGRITVSPTHTDVVLFLHRVVRFATVSLDSCFEHRACCH